MSSFYSFPLSFGSFNHFSDLVFIKAHNAFYFGSLSVWEKLLVVLIYGWQWLASHSESNQGSRTLSLARRIQSRKQINFTQLWRMWKVKILEEVTNLRCRAYPRTEVRVQRGGTWEGPWEAVPLPLLSCLRSSSWCWACGCCWSTGSSLERKS